MQSPDHIQSDQGMTPTSKLWSLSVRLAFILALGLVIGLVLWPRLSLPYENPYHIVSFMTDAQYNPSNNTLRFLLLLLCPTILLLLSYRFNLVSIRSQLQDSAARMLHRATDLDDSRSLRAEDTIADPKHYIRSKWELLIWMIAAGVCALAMPTYLAWGPFDSYHEGESMGVAVSYEQGQVPYRDFSMIHGIFQDPLRSVVAFELFGRSIGSVRSFESMLKVLCWSVLLLWCIRLFRYHRLLSLGTFVFLGTLCMNGGMTLMQRDILLFVVGIAVISMHEELQKAESIRSLRKMLLLMALAACLTFAAFAYSIDRAVYLVVTSMVFLPLFIYRMKSGQRLKALSTVIASSLIGLSITILSMKGGFPEFIEFCFVQMPKYKDLLDGFIYPIFSPRFLIFIILCAALVFALVASFVRLLSAMTFKQATRAFLERYSLHFYMVLLALLLYRNVIGRPDVTHLEYSIYPLLMAVALFGQTVFLRLVHRLQFPQLRAATLMMVVLTICCVFVCVRYDVYYSNFPLSTPDSVFTPESHRKTTEWLKANMKEDEQFMTFTSEEIWFYYLNKPCPLRFGMITIAMPDFFCDEVLREWPKKRIRYVLYRSWHWANLIEGHPINESMPRLDAYIRAHYHPCKTIGGQELWEWNTPM